MFSKYRSGGIVLKKYNQGESDRIFTIYTEEFGKISLFAKSIRKESSKLKSGSEPFSLSEIEFIEGRSRRTLTDIRVINRYREINGNLKKITLAQKIVDDLDRLIKGEEKDEKVWELLVKVFSDIESSRGLSAYYRFFWNLVTILGYGPELHQCSRCHNKIDLKDLRLSPSDGGLVCKKCSSESVSFSIEKRALKMMLSYLNGDLVKINSDDKRMLWSMSQNYLFSIES